MDKRERAELINRPNYWGIIGRRDAMHILSNVADRKGTSNAGWFVWECTKSNPATAFLDVNSYCVAVTQLYSVRKNKFYVRKTHSGLSPALGVYETFKYDVDAYTLYIVRSPRDGRYYEFGDKKALHLCRIPYDKEYRQMFSSSTLSKAIERARLRFHSFARMLVHQCPPLAASICPAVSRFVSYNQRTKSCVNRVWSLQSLCLFFVKNYLKVYRSSSYRGPHLPKKIETLIRQMRAVIETNEVWRTAGTSVNDLMVLGIE
jgi:hypothetical protein